MKITGLLPFVMHSFTTPEKSLWEIAMLSAGSPESFSILINIPARSAYNMYAHAEQHYFSSG